MYDGSLRNDWKSMVVFQQMIILADQNGIIDMTPQALHHRTGIPLEIIEYAISELEKKDPQSRSPAENGRRIIRLDKHRTWGWQLVNHAYYRGLVSSTDRRKYMKNYMREYRRENSPRKHSVNSRKQSLADLTHTDTEAEASTEADTSLEGTKVPSRQKSSSFVPCPHNEIIELYHQILPELPRVKAWGGENQKKLRTRWRSSKDYQRIEWWSQFFKYIKTSRFLMGKTKDWSASLSWIVQAGKFENILNGQYHRDTIKQNFGRWQNAIQSVME
jgi:hypothetical protein